jgi:integrase
MNPTATMVSLAEDYLAARRQMGFSLEPAGAQLLGFARFADKKGHRGPVSFDLAVQWIQSTSLHTPLTWARRLEVLRPFLKYRSQFDAATAMVPRCYFGPAHRRLVPHIYTEEEIVALMQATDRLQPTDGLRPKTYRALFGLLAATGLRISETLHLQTQDVDWVQGILTVRQTKFCKSRLVPLHLTVLAALKQYVDDKERQLGRQKDGAFFVSDTGEALHDRTVHCTFEGLRTRLGWIARGGHPSPRIHDIRHTFICRSLLDCYHRNESPDHIMDAISTYVGHVKVSDTYWYLTATPELMTVAAQRFAQFVEGGAR